ncbi:hypothetical protein HT031_003826 [Scenedesmus sp. PABB004]|nr:hypothetical protein HT031_003826 [Scenedesmus sp. PABB004]
MSLPRPIAGGAQRQWQQEDDNDERVAISIPGSQHDRGGIAFGTPSSSRSGWAAARLAPSGGGIYLGLEPGLSSPLLEHGLAGPRGAAAAPVPASPPPRAAEAPGVVAFASPEPGAPALPPGAGSPAPAPGAAAAAAPAAAAPGEGAGGKRRGGSLRNDVIYGIINAVVGIPTMISFAAIVYQDPIYKPLLGQLARIAFFSAAVHQAVFTACSTLPFAVGQPQDVGLIFLSAMATGVADIGRDQGLSDKVIVGTALLTLTVATVVVGLLTVAVAKFRLATLVQYVPLPVVGGYLGYVGYFCLAAGIGLGSNVQIGSFTSWGQLLDHDALIKFVPTFAAALVLWACMTRARSPWALPITLAAVPAAFHAYLLVSGTSLADAQDAGWVLKPQGKATEQFWELYELFNIRDLEFDGVSLGALARQAPKMLGLFFVVVFGSCLDVAAIQADMPFPIDFNSELGTVGLSNVLVGLSGAGYTGSYIFSQTIFSMRAGVSGVAHGAIIAGLEAAIFLLPFSVVQYLPNFFFGALLTVFGIEIAGDWLIRSYAKVTREEYLLLLATFLAIMQLELERGVAAGMLLCATYFCVTYARANMAAFAVLPTRSAAVRSYHESHVLEVVANRLATVALSGFMFFGSSVLMSSKVIQVAEDMVAAVDSSNDAKADAAAAAAAARGPGGKDHARAAVAAPPPAQRSGSGGPLRDLRLASLAVMGNKPPGAGAAASGAGDDASLDAEALALLERSAPCFVILDFRRVLGVDATAAQTLGSLAMVLRRMGVELVLTRVAKPSVRRLLVAHGIIAPRHHRHRAAGGEGGAGEPLLDAEAGGGEEGEEDEGGYCRVFDTLNQGAKYAEDRLLAMAQAAGLLRQGLTGLDLRQFFEMHCSQALLTAGVDAARITAEVAKLGVPRSLSPGQRLFSFGEEPNSFYLILKGVVSIEVKPLAVPAVGFRPAPAQLDTLEVERDFSSGQGAVVGITDFVLNRLRSFQAVTSSECVLLEVSRPALEAMVAEVPAVATALQAILLRDACLSEVYAYEVLERAARA